jgi:hypothetical protein
VQTSSVELEMSQASQPQCANFFEAGNVSRFPIPVGNLFQWMLEMSQGSAAAIFFSGCWKFLKLPHPSVQTFSLDAGNVSSFPTPVWKLFHWMLEMSQASPPQCANTPTQRIEMFLQQLSGVFFLWIVQ